MTAPLITPDNITGVLLAGGRSRRIGGGDKGLLDLAGKTMMQHSIERIKRHVRTLVINANGDLSRFAIYGLDVFSDRFGDHLGPLAGILSGMCWARENTPQARWIATVPVDTPLLPFNLMERLKTASEANPGAISIAHSNGRFHPVIAMWPVELSDDLDRALKNGIRKVLHWTAQHDSIAVDFPLLEIAGRSVDPFFNVNTITELEEARALLCELGSNTNYWGR